MNRDERNAIVATIGLAIAALGAFSPWARIGGRNRSGFNTADTFISLADGALPDQVAWSGVGGICLRSWRLSPGQQPLLPDTERCEL